MRVLDRYIVKAICSAAMLVMAVLLCLLALFLFFDEQGWVGVGRYGNLQALHYVLLNLPATLTQFLPVAALIGALRAMGGLARGSELVVMRAAGVPIWRIGVSVALAGLCLVPLAVVVGEYMAPPLTQAARINKAVQRNANISMTGRNAAWIPEAGHILKAERLPGGAGFGDLTLFEIGADNQLLSVGRATGAHVNADGGWELEGFAQSRFEAERVVTASAAIQKLDVQSSPAFLGALASDPKELSWRELQNAIAHLRANGQDTRQYRFAYWSKLAGLCALPLAVLLAMPFALRTARGVEGGTRAVVGLAFGLAYFILQRMLESSAMVFDVSPSLLAWLPVALLTLVVAVLLARLRVN